MPPLIALGLLLCPPGRGVKSAETVPGRRRGGWSDADSPPGGVNDSYNGEGCLYEPEPLLMCGVGIGGGFEVTCKLALLV